MTRLLRRRHWLALSAAPWLGLTGRPAGAASTEAGAPLALPALPFTHRTLANGLQVVAQPGGQGGNVAVQVWYRVGGKDDPAGRSGFAHLFEHLMFKRTRHLQPEQFDRLTEDVGGENNAFTAEDVTAYQNRVPANHLERLLWAEAERMSNLDVDEASFHSERAVVQEEYRQRVLASPYGRLFEAIAPAAFEVHPYARPVIGSIADLDAATLADVRAFHATYYRPDNAILIVTGSFDEAALQRAVDRWFAPLARPATPVPRVTVREPRRPASRTVHLSGPNVPLPAALCVWQGPPAAHADAPALQIAQALLAGGDSARLNQALVRRQRVARSAGFGASLYEDAGALMAYAIAAGDLSPQRLVAPLQAEITRLARGPLPAAELDKVKAQIVTAALSARQTPEGRAEALGWAMIHHHDPARVQHELEALQAVSAADVQRVLRTHVVDRPAVTVLYTQGAAVRPADPSPAPATTASTAPAAARPASAP